MAHAATISTLIDELITAVAKISLDQKVIPIEVSFRIIKS